MSITVRIIFDTAAFLDLKTTNKHKGNKNREEVSW